MKAPKTLSPPRPREKHANKASSAPLWDKRWKRVRQQAKTRDAYMCQECKRNGIITPVDEVDHIIPRQQRPDLVYDIDNVQCICRACHLEKTKREQGA